jgi:hypothetical protein
MASVRDVRIVVLKVWNSGTETIKLEDYYKDNPIKINFGNEAEILEAEVLDTAPKIIQKEISSSLRLEAGSVVIPPIVIESNNSITVQVLITKFKNAREISLSETRILEASIQDWDQTIQARLEKEAQGKNGSMSLLEELQWFTRNMCYYWTAVLLFILLFVILIWTGIIIYLPNNSKNAFVPSNTFFSSIGISITQNNSTNILVSLAVTMAIISIVFTTIFYFFLKRSEFVRNSRILNAIFNPVKKVKKKNKV